MAFSINFPGFPVNYLASLPVVAQATYTSHGKNFLETQLAKTVPPNSSHP